MPHTKAGLGVLVANLGTPDAPTPAALKRYLAEFLSDPDVVDLPRMIWWPLLHGVVLRKRPAQSAEAYARIWTPQGSPLLVNTQSITRALQAELQDRLGGTVLAVTGMRYGQPSLADALGELRGAGVTALVVLPLYPQYAGATAGSTISAITHLVGATPTFIQDYYAHRGYLDALATSVRAFRDAHGQGEKLLISFHGIPQQVLRKGDPYYAHCARTARYLTERLQLKPEQWQLVFQSRFGRTKWLQPYTEDTLKQLAAQGVKTVDVICPGFAADCLETLEEIALRYAESFHAAGGRELHYIPALNDRPVHIRALADLVMSKLTALRHS